MSPISRLSKTGRFVAGSLTILAGAACGSVAGGPSPGERTGIARIALDSVPNDVKCLRIQAAGSYVAFQDFHFDTKMPTPTPTELEMDNIAVGPDAFTAQAFAVACEDAKPGAPPTWQSSAV